MPRTFAVVEVQSDRLALVYVQVGEPHGESKQHQQQQKLELLPDFLNREAQHPRSEPERETRVYLHHTGLVFNDIPRRGAPPQQVRLAARTGFKTHTHKSYSDVRLDARVILAAFFRSVLKMLGMLKVLKMLEVLEIDIRTDVFLFFPRVTVCNDGCA